MNSRNHLSEALKLLRLYCGYSQAELANILEVSQSLISDIENARKEVSMNLLSLYSEKFNIRMSALLFFAEEIEDRPLNRKGNLIIAEKVLDILEKLKPKRHDEASV